MWFVVAGCLLLAMKLAEYGFAADWSWWSILLPFGLAVAWWTFADASGLTKRREMDKLEERKHERRRRHMDALGLNWRRDRRVAVIKEVRVAPQPMAADWALPPRRAPSTPPRTQPTMAPVAAPPTVLS